jgi:hypothetical protein
MLGAPFVDHLDCGTPVSSLHDIHRIYDGFHASAHRLAVIKAPLSLSGHNFVFIRHKVDILNQTTRLTKLLKTHSTLVMEPWLDKVFDYSLQIEITPQGQILEKGIARFITDTKGRYLGAMVGGLFNDLNSDLVRFLSGISWAPSDSQRITVLTKVNQELARYVGRELLKCGYSGPVGIDQFVFKNEKGEFRIKPLVEINPRYNMGRVAVELGRRVPPGRAALWNVYSQKDLLKMNIRSFQHFAQAIEKHFPPMELNSRNQILSGPLWLSPPTSAQEFCALLIVGESYGQLKEKMEAIS